MQKHNQIFCNILNILENNDIKQIVNPYEKVITQKPGFLIMW